MCQPELFFKLFLRIIFTIKVIGSIGFEYDKERKNEYNSKIIRINKENECNIINSKYLK